MAAGAISCVGGASAMRLIADAMAPARTVASRLPETLREGSNHLFGVADAPQMAKNIRSQTSGRGHPTFEAFAAQVKQQNLFLQNRDRSGRRIRGYGGPDVDGVDFDAFARRVAGRKLSQEAVGIGIGIVGESAALLDHIQPLDHHIKASQTVSDQGRSDRPIAPANRRQDIFGRVHRAPHCGKINNSGAPFERMKRTE